MRTISAKYPKDQEPPRRWMDDVRLLWFIGKMGLHYVIAGRRIRKVWYAKQRAGDKFYVDET